MEVIPGFEGPMYLWPEVKTVPGIKGRLKILKEKYLICLVTNAADSSEDDIKKALSRAGIDIYFDKIYCHKTTGLLKPSREYFSFVINDLKLNPENIIMAGDNFEADIKGANNSGIFGIWLNRSGKNRKSGELYDTILGLPELQDAINRYLNR